MCVCVEFAIKCLARLFSIFLDNFILILCVLVCLNVWLGPHACSILKDRGGFGSLDTELADGFKPPCGCWKLNLAPLEEQPLFLTAKPTLQLQKFFVYFLRLGLIM